MNTAAFLLDDHTRSKYIQDCPGLTLDNVPLIKDALRLKVPKTAGKWRYECHSMEKTVEDGPVAYVLLQLVLPQHSYSVLQSLLRDPLTDHHLIRSYSHGLDHGDLMAQIEENTLTFEDIELVLPLVDRDYATALLRSALVMRPPRDSARLFQSLLSLESVQIAVNHRVANVHASYSVRLLVTPDNVLTEIIPLLQSLTLDYPEFNVLVLPVASSASLTTWMEQAVLAEKPHFSRIAQLLPLVAFRGLSEAVQRRICRFSFCGFLERGVFPLGPSIFGMKALPAPLRVHDLVRLCCDLQATDFEAGAAAVTTLLERGLTRQETYMLHHRFPQNEDIWARIVARHWSSPQFRGDYVYLLKDPVYDLSRDRKRCLTLYPDHWDEVCIRAQRVDELAVLCSGAQLAQLVQTRSRIALATARHFFDSGRWSDLELVIRRCPYKKDPDLRKYVSFMATREAGDTSLPSGATRKRKEPSEPRTEPLTKEQKADNPLTKEQKADDIDRGEVKESELDITLHKLGFFHGSTLFPFEIDERLAALISPAAHVKTINISRIRPEFVGDLILIMLDTHDDRFLELPALVSFRLLSCVL